METELDGGGTVIRVGDEDVEVTGAQTYVLAYRVLGVADRRAGRELVAWDAVGTG